VISVFILFSPLPRSVEFLQSTFADWVTSLSLHRRGLPIFLYQSLCFYIIFIIINFLFGPTAYVLTHFDS
jgi:hypothetical protein